MLSDEAAEVSHGTPRKARVMHDSVDCSLTSVLFLPLPMAWKVSQDAEVWQDGVPSLDIRVSPAFEGSQMSNLPLTQGCLVM